MLIIGSAAGVVVMGLEKITFRLVYEAHLLDCFRRLHRRYRLLLVHPHLPLCYLKDNTFLLREKVFFEEKVSKSHFLLKISA